MEKFDDEIGYFERAFICLFLFLNKYYYLNIETYVYQKIGVEINFFCLIFSFIYLLINGVNEINIKALALLIIIKIQSTYLQSFTFFI